jgi:hypothetical protein
VYFDWTDLARIDWHALEAIGTVSLALVTFVTIRFLRKAARDQTEALKLQTDALNAQTDAVKTQAKMLETSVIQTTSTELLTLGRWLADNHWYRCGLEAPEDTYTRWGEDAAAVYADFMDHISGLWDRLPSQYREAWEPWMVDRLKEYPQIRKFVRDGHHSSWYGPTLTKLVGEAPAAATPPAPPPAAAASPPAPAPVTTPETSPEADGPQSATDAPPVS